MLFNRRVNRTKQKCKTPNRRCGFYTPRLTSTSSSACASHLYTHPALFVPFVLSPPPSPSLADKQGGRDTTKVWIFTKQMSSLVIMKVGGMVASAEDDESEDEIDGRDGKEEAEEGVAALAVGAWRRSGGGLVFVQIFAGHRFLFRFPSIVNLILAFVQTGPNRWTNFGLVQFSLNENVGSFGLLFLSSSSTLSLPPYYIL